MGEQIQFSEREKQVTELLILGKSNKQIALSLGISVRAVEFHLSNIYTKLGVSSRTEAALKLSKTQLRESTGDTLRESAGTEAHQPDHNVARSIATRRITVDKSFLTKLVLLILLAFVCLVAMVVMALQRESGQGLVPSFIILQVTILIRPTEIYIHDCSLFKENAR